MSKLTRDRQKHQVHIRTLCNSEHMILTFEDAENTQLIGCKI